MSTQRGTSTVQANGVRIKYSNAGNKIEYDYEGTQAQCAALVATLRTAGYDVEYTASKSPLASLTATWPDREAPGRTGDITDTDNSTGLITAPAHELLTGDGITVSGIVGLTGGVTYYVLVLSVDTFKTYTNFNLATQIKPTNNDDTGTFTKVESPLPRWELFSEEVEVSANQAVYIDKLAGAQLTDVQRKIVGKAVRGEIVTVAEAATFSAGVQLDFLDTVIRDGLHTITYNRPVICASRTATRGWNNSYAGTNVNKILTTAQMTSLELMEAGLLDGLVAYPALTGTLVGWKKEFPRREAMGGGLFAISQKFIYGWWNTAVFVAAS